METTNEQQTAAAIEKLRQATETVSELLADLSTDTLQSHESRVALLVQGVINELNHLQSIAARSDVADHVAARAALSEYRAITTEYADQMRALRK